MPVRVCVTIISRDEIPPHTPIECAQRACAYAQERGVMAVCGKGHSAHAVDHARNRAVAGALMDERNFTHVFMVDDDVLIPEDAIVRLLAVPADVAGGCYPGVKPFYDDGQMLRQYVMVRRNKRWCASWFNGIVECDAMGGGCMMIRRTVLERLGFPWFRWPQEWDGSGKVQHKSDDVDFCLRAAEAGFALKADGQVRCSHIKRVDLAMFISDPGEPVWVSTWQGARSVAQRNAWPAYGSHVPVLIGVGRLLGPDAATIVEYGAGRWSTPVFLDREWFDDASRIISYESDPHWIQSIEERRGEDDRHIMYLTPVNLMAESVHPEADIVLIDCDTVWVDNEDDNKFAPRLDLIRAYERLDGPVVIVHDCNFKSIRPTVEASAFKYRHIHIPKHGPHTAVLSNSVDVTNLHVPDVPYRTEGANAHHAPIPASIPVG